MISLPGLVRNTTFAELPAWARTTRTEQRPQGNAEDHKGTPTYQPNTLDSEGHA